MTDFSLAAIKKDNTRKVFDCILTKKQIKRKELSDVTGLSLMTVGKLVDALAALGVITYEKAAGEGVGRKPSSIFVNEKAHFAMLDTLEGKAHFSLYNVKLETVGTASDDEGELFENIIKLFVEKELVGSVLSLGYMGDCKAIADKCALLLKTSVFEACEPLRLAALADFKNKGKSVLYFKDNRACFVNSLYGEAVMGPLERSALDGIGTFLSAEPVISGDTFVKNARLGAAFYVRDAYINK